ncbi:MAG: toll/interleukin-1 receptor domain-containing protein [Alphaproteobacteria bacterium]|nr:toll/interleukin-1 receptor domain-containing protein [Alphaproteobacteria bacterium]
MKAFMSYNSKDAAFASALRESIERDGVRVFDPARDTPPGLDLFSRLREEIEASDVLILVVPETGTANANTAFFEAGAAKALGKKVLAVMPDARGRQSPSGIADLAIFEAADKPVDDVAKTLVHAFEPA